jgi:Terminase large subunit, T4likevirus-type, N-terminal
MITSDWENSLSRAGRNELVRAQEPADIADAVAFARERLGFYPDEKQELVLQGGRRGIVNCTRQWGKSTVTALKAVHRAYSRPGSLILVLAPSKRQSREFLRKAEEFVRRLGIRIRGDGANPSIVFPNGSRIVGLPGVEATTRGFSNVSLLIVEEASRVPDKVYWAMRPTLAAGDGDLWLISTPNGKRGFFWEEWERGREEWERISVTGPECARLSAKFLAEERRKDEPRFQREFLCQFGEVEGATFSQESIDAALAEDYPGLSL